MVRFEVTDDGFDCRASVPSLACGRFNVCLEAVDNLDTGEVCVSALLTIAEVADDALWLPVGDTNRLLES